MKIHIFESIEVIAYFHNLQIEIIRFRWKGGIYNVSKVNSFWKIPSGNSIEYHFTVFCEKQEVLCELSFNLGDFKWQLIKVENIY